MWPWTTKPVISVIFFFFLRFIHHLKLSMYGLLGYGNIWLRYKYLNIWNLRVKKNQNIEKVSFKVVQMKFLAMHIIFMVGNLQNIFMEHDR